jgi:hypothetical protein
MVNIWLLAVMIRRLNCGVLSRRRNWWHCRDIATAYNVLPFQLMVNIWLLAALIKVSKYGVLSLREK